jgi:RNA polymerase sigma-70 factor, ECF subfamily
VNAAIAEMDTAFDFERAFHAHYARIARVIARVIRDPARSEELAVEVLWKFWRTPSAHTAQPGGWLYRAAVRVALNELRRRTRATRHESLADTTPGAPTPEDVRAALELQEQVRCVLGALDARQSELLILRSSGLSYEEVAAALELNSASVGTLLSRAQQAFRKEFLHRYGEQ